MTEKLWENPEVKDLTLKLVAVFGLLVVLTLLFANYFWASLNRQLIENNLAIMGDVINLHPELQDEIVTSFTHPKNPAAIQQGLAAAKLYGYDTTLPLSTVPILSDFSTRSFFGLVMLACIYLLTFLGIFLRSLRTVFQRANGIASASEKIVEGDFSLKFGGTGEGVFAKLEHQFNHMSRRLELTVDALKQEKIYLKNMISDISHQLKTPISSLKVFNELMLEGVDPHQAREFLGHSSTQIERMEWLIGNLLTLARIDAGVIEFGRDNQPLLPTIEEAINALGCEWQTQGQMVSIRGDNDLCLPHDKRWLGEAIRNIIKNSIEHTQAGGEIEICLVDTPVMGRVVIKDNGQGIDKEDLPHIFQRFYRGKHSVQGSGTGIGLALAKSIIENQGGIITVKSELGKGTEFVLTFLKGVI